MPFRGGGIQAMCGQNIQLAAVTVGVAITRRAGLRRSFPSRHFSQLRPGRALEALNFHQCGLQDETFHLAGIKFSRHWRQGVGCPSGGSPPAGLP